MVSTASQTLGHQHSAATCGAREESHTKVTEFPDAPPEFSKLDQGYTVRQVSSWAEQRTCAKTGHSTLFATAAFKAGEALCDFEPTAILPEPNYLSVQVGDDKHIMMAPDWLHSTNHSCAPSVLFNAATMKYEALTDIEPGTELCFFYPSTEWTMSAPFKCCCGASCCLGRIDGAKHMGAEALAGYRLCDHISAKLGVPVTPNA